MPGQRLGFIYQIGGSWLAARKQAIVISSSVLVC